MKLSGYIAARLLFGQVTADNRAIMDTPLNEDHWAYLSDWKKRCNGPHTIPALLESLGSAPAKTPMKTRQPHSLGPVAEPRVVRALRRLCRGQGRVIAGYCWDGRPTERQLYSQRRAARSIGARSCRSHCACVPAPAGQGSCWRTLGRLRRRADLPQF